MKNLIQNAALTLILLSSTLFNQIYNEKAVFILAGLGVLIAILNLKTDRKRDKKIERTLVILAILSTLSWIFSSTKNIGLSEIITQISCLTIVVSLYNHNTWIKSFRWTLAGIVLIQAIFAITQFIYLPETRSAGTFFSTHNNALYYPNALALFALSATPIFFIRKKLSTTPQNFIIATLGILTLITSLSRGGVIAFSLTLIASLIALIIYKQPKKIIAIALAGLLATSSFALINQKRIDNNLITEDLTERSQFEGTDSLTSISERQQFFTNTFKLIAQKPITGYGPNSFEYVYPQVQPMLLANAPHPHNIFLKIASEQGLMTLAILILTLILILIRYIKYFPKQKKVSKINSLIVLSTLLGALAHNLVDYNLNFVLNLLLLILLLTYLLTYTFKSEKAKTTVNSNLVILCSLTLILSGFMLSQHYYLSKAKDAYANNDFKQTISQLEKISPRTGYLNAFNILADTYEITDQKGLAIATLNTQIKANRFDAFAYNELGNLNSDDPKRALDYYKKAVSINPKNFFNFYANYYRLLKVENLETFNQDKPKIESLLKQYLPLAQYNIHYTSQTGNIVEAIELANIFDLNEIASELQSFKETFSSN